MNIKHTNNILHILIHAEKNIFNFNQILFE